jgi:hypothetical protein
MLSQCTAAATTPPRGCPPGAPIPFKRHIPSRLAILLAILGAVPAGRAHAQPVHPGAAATSEKEQRSAAAQKIDSQLLYALYAKRGESAARGTPTETTIEVDAEGRTPIDVRADVTPKLEQQVRALGGTIVSTSETHRSILTRFPLEKLEELASLPDVRFIRPAPRPVTD